MNWLSLIGSPLAKEGLPVLNEFMELFGDSASGDSSWEDKALAGIRKAKEFFPLLKAAKQVKAVGADAVTLRDMLRTIGVDPTEESVTQISALIPQFARDPEQDLLSFMLSGKFVDMMKHKMNGGTADDAHGVHLCPGCGLATFHNIHKELK